MTLTVIVEKSAGNWGAYAPDLVDSVIATGDTREEAIQNFAMRCWICLITSENRGRTRLT